MCVQLVFVLALQLALVQVEDDSHLLVLLKLHDDEGIPGLALAQRRIQANTQHAVHVVGLGQHHELLDGVVLDLVVVGLSAESERSFVHVDVEPSSVGLFGQQTPSDGD